MTLKQKLKIVTATSLAWIICLSSCADLNIKTWYLDASDRGELVRNDDSGNLIEAKTYLEANGYLCYSPEDDEAWRTRLDNYAKCCNSKGAL